MNEKSDALFERLMDFSVSIIHLITNLPKQNEARVIGKQVVRCGTSVGAHYAEARRAKSNADLVSKLEGGLQELEETGYWLAILKKAKIVAPTRLTELDSEVDQLIRIHVASIKSVKARIEQSKRQTNMP